MARCQINLRLTGAEKDAIHAHAKARSKSVSRYLIECALSKEQGRATLDLEMLAKTQAELVKMQESLTRLTTLADGLSQNTRSAQALTLADELYRILKPLSAEITGATLAVLKALRTR